MLRSPGAIQMHRANPLIFIGFIGVCIFKFCRSAGMAHAPRFDSSPWLRGSDTATGGSARAAAGCAAVVPWRSCHSWVQARGQGWCGVGDTASVPARGCRLHGSGAMGPLPQPAAGARPGVASLFFWWERPGRVSIMAPCCYRATTAKSSGRRSAALASIRYVRPSIRDARPAPVVRISVAQFLPFSSENMCSLKRHNLSIFCRNDQILSWHIRPALQVFRGSYCAAIVM